MILTLESIGSDQETLATSVHVSTAAGGAIMASDIFALSAATQPLYYVTSVIAGGGASPRTSTYSTSEDVAVLTFAAGTTGARVVVTIPSPVDSIFLAADHETVDPTAIATLIAATLSNCVTPGGVNASAYLYGYRRKLERR